MKFPGFVRYLTGVLVPLSALRTDDSVGVGEFPDLPLLGRWCVDVGLDLIQILPVNDTGWQPSPYSALSAFALHPIYLRIQDLPEMAALDDPRKDQVTAELESMKRRFGCEARLDYSAVRDGKISILRSIFTAAGDRDALRSFARDNPWVREFALFKALKERCDGRSWREWPDHHDPGPGLFGALAADPELGPVIDFFIWLQCRAEEQFRAAAIELSEMGVLLKGDLPILINEDSADVWARRELFTLRLRAGAPPDGESAAGQNWDLPIYDWEAMREDGFAWWKARLHQADKFYSAYRIDHVLGFFRVWACPVDDATGARGHFRPAATATREMLHQAGFDDGRIRWLAEPHLPGVAVRDALGKEFDLVREFALSQVGEEDLYLFADHIRGERDIYGLSCSEHAREWLARQFRDRALIRLEHDRYAGSWTFYQCSRFGELGEQEQDRFRRLMDELGARSGELWKDQATELLGQLRQSSAMLPCAEDLGAIPPSVPEVLSSLRILGLRIPRWSRRWHEEGQPYIPPSSYPFLTVCAPSVHDTSTLRGWWEEEPVKQPFWESLGLPGRAPDAYDAGAARQVIEALMGTTSSICVFQLQDILALGEGALPADPAEERFNLPGTVGPANWSYRFAPTLESLRSDNALIAVLKQMIDTRRSRSIATSP